MITEITLKMEIKKIITIRHMFEKNGWQLIVHRPIKTFLKFTLPIIGSFHDCVDVLMPQARKLSHTMTP